MLSKSAFHKANLDKSDGRYEVNSGGDIKFLAFTNRNSPETIARLQQITSDARYDGSLRLSVPMPLLQNKALVNSGFVTAAYLLWFSELGYSWALQSHLSTIRRQIRSPHEQTIPISAIPATTNVTFTNPYIGFGIASDHLVLFAAIANRLVLFPTLDDAALYDKLPKDVEGLKLRQLQVLEFGRPKGPYCGPIGLAYDNALLTAPDTFLRGQGCPILWFPIQD